MDNKRDLGPVSGDTSYLELDTADAENTGINNIGVEFNINGFTASLDSTTFNADGGNYLALIEFDTNKDGNGSYDKNEPSTLVSTFDKDERMGRDFKIKTTLNNKEDEVTKIIVNLDNEVI